MIVQPTTKHISTEFDRCFRLLEIPVSVDKINSLSQLIQESMSHKNRYFHQASHIFELLDQSDAILNLAALFHDTVYFQVDQELPKPIAHLLKEVIKFVGSDIFIYDDILNYKPELNSVFKVFGYKPGDKLNISAGLNEFLSAIVADISLRKTLSETQIIQVHMCVEATIPFRSECPLVELQERVSQLYKDLNLNIQNSELKAQVLRAAELANRDVKNFANADPSWFLATTWLLLPERNPLLRSDRYTFEDYRQSLLKMEEFFNFLSPNVVFKKYAENPTDEHFDLLNLRAARNIQIAREYLDIKILSIGLLEALAKETGGDLPITEMLGKVRATNQPGVRMEDFLPHHKPRIGLNISLYSLFCDGRALETNFDLRNSPFAAYLYSSLENHDLRSIRKLANSFFKNNLEPLQLLSEVPYNVLSDIINACKKVCSTRQEKFEEIIKSLDPKNKKAIS